MFEFAQTTASCLITLYPQVKHNECDAVFEGYQSYSEYVTVWAKTWHVRTQTEIYFIAPAYSYTK